MDPATIIGTTGAILGIVEVACKLIGTLRTLRDRWQSVALTISNLMTQLTSVKAALEKISDWIQSDLVEESRH